MTPDEVLARLVAADKIKIKDPKHRLLDKWHLRWCNGGINVNAERGREASCANRSAYEQINISDSSLLQTAMEILFRSCGVYASYPDNDEGVSCGMLGRLFFRIGNAPAARAVWEQAPDCNVLDRGGHPVNGCIDAILGPSGAILTEPSGQEYQTSDAGVDWSFGGVNYMEAYASEPQELLKLASDACSKDNDYGACQFLEGKGANINLDSVAAYNSRRIQQNGNAEAAADRVAQINAEEHQERVNALVSALSSLPGANDPNAIVDTANQEASQMVAVGAANDAARAQAGVQQVQANAQQTVQQAAQQTTNQPTSTSSGSGPVAPVLPANCIAVSESSREEAAFGDWIFTNNCGVGVNIVVTGPPDPQVTGNQYDIYQNSWLAPGQSLRGTQANEPYKYFACPSPWSAFDGATSAGNIVNPRYETTKTVCLQVDASGNIIAH